MAFLHECINSKCLLIVTRDKVMEDIEGSKFIPCVVLISAWRKESANFSRALICDLLRSGCVFFVCAGYFAEELHDYIDDIIASSENCGSGVVTTFHEDESIDDIVNFTLNAIDVSEKCSGGTVAILDYSSPEDVILRNGLLTS